MLTRKKIEEHTIRSRITGEDYVKYRSSYLSYHYKFLNGEIQFGINEKLEKSDSEISSNTAKFEPVVKNARYVRCCIKKDLGFVILAALLPTEENIHLYSTLRHRAG